MKNRIITIGRQYGSGGRAIGQKTAGRLGIPYYDKELILLAAEKSGLSKELLDRVDETATNSFLYAVSTGAYFMGGFSPTQNNLPVNDTLFLALADVIRNLAQQGPCVIVGRCADAVLSGRDDLLRVFVYDDKERRVRRVMQRQDLPEKKARELIGKEDRRRASYYRFYTQHQWGDIENYDLMINTNHISADDAAGLIASAAAFE